MKKSEFIAKYGQEAWDKKTEQTKQWRTMNRGKSKAYAKSWRDRNKEKSNETTKQWQEQNKERVSAIRSRWRKNNLDKERENLQRYRTTKNGRATAILSAYKQSDILDERGECTLTQRWILENIFNSSCVYCGDSDWHHLGCDRVDNSLPHTPENCVCACGICNIEREYNRMSISEFKEYRKSHPRDCDK